jgi:hypothetical protein
MEENINITEFKLIYGEVKREKEEEGSETPASQPGAELSNLVISGDSYSMQPPKKRRGRPRKDTLSTPTLSITTAIPSVSANAVTDRVENQFRYKKKSRGRPRKNIVLDHGLKAKNKRTKNNDELKQFSSAKAKDIGGDSGHDLNKSKNGRIFSDDSSAMCEFKCSICGKPAKSLRNHLQLDHGLTVNEFIALHPEILFFRKTYHRYCLI